MKSLITGANGFTGSHLVKALQQRGDEVVGLVRKSSNLERLDDVLDNTNVKLAYGDITDKDSLTQAMEGIDRIFHTAAYVELGLVDAEKMKRINVEGTKNVLETAKDAGISKMVYCSTIGVYGDTQGQVIDETYKRTQENFSSAYDSTKYEAQKLVDEFATNGLPVVSIMPSGILGADDPHFGPIFNLFIQGKLKIWVGGDRITGIVHVDDLVDAIILAAERGKVGEHYIISAGQVPTREMFEIISQETNLNHPVELPEVLVRVAGNILEPIGKLLSWNPPIGKERVHYLYDRCVQIDATKAKQELGWQPRSVSKTLQDIIKQLQTN
ncbi:MAG: NAD-dependent epimerase/dehydratase family protein [Cyanobacteria bacterium P01_A01_bin.84]